MNAMGFQTVLRPELQSPIIAAFHFPADPRFDASGDGVIGALAITKDIVIIMIGLSIGAMFVRSMTVYLVRKGTLDKFVFLEHGAHYAIGILALIMLASMKFHIPELFTGLIGVAFILAAFWTSVLYKRKHKAIPR